MISLVPDHARTTSIVFIAGAPALAALACVLRDRDPATNRSGWLAIAVAMALWSAGALAHLLPPPTPDAEPIFNPGLGMLLFVLYMVPLGFALGYPGSEPWPVRAVDGALALMLGYMFSVNTFDYAHLLGTPDENVPGLRRMFDIGNAFILGFALLRWQASPTPAQRTLFGTLALYAGVYLAVAAYINHVEPSDADYGNISDTLIGAPFLLLAVAAGRKPPPPARPAAQAAPAAPAARVRLVQAASPLVLPIALLLVSINLTRVHPLLAIVGFVSATLGYGLRNVLEKLNAMERLEQLDSLARIDPLTGLANRRQFDEVLTREWDRARRGDAGLSLLMIDIDHFKALNDHYGHQTGDKYLQAVAKVLDSTPRTSDFAARWGGEEFAVLIPAGSRHDAARIAERIRDRVRAAGLPGAPDPSSPVTVSIGVAVLESVRGSTPCQLLAAADAALYSAKHGGRDRVELHG